MESWSCKELELWRESSLLNSVEQKWHQPVLLLKLLLKLLKLLKHLEPEMVACCCTRCCRREERFKLVKVQMVYQDMVNFHRQR